jgi:hypothetical protein
VYYRLVVRPTVRRARALLTVSEFARRELAGRLGVPESRWTVVPPGVDARFRPPSAEERLEARARYGLPPRYLLAVGNPQAPQEPGAPRPHRRSPPRPARPARRRRGGAGVPQAYPGALRGRRGGATRAVRRRRGAPPPLATRGLRAARAGGDGHRHAGDRRERRVAARDDRRCRRAARPRRSGGVDRRERRAGREPGAARPLGRPRAESAPGPTPGSAAPVRPSPSTGRPWADSRRAEPGYTRPTPQTSAKSSATLGWKGRWWAIPSVW